MIEYILKNKHNINKYSRSSKPCWFQRVFSPNTKEWIMWKFQAPLQEWGRYLEQRGIGGVPHVAWRMHIPGWCWPWSYMSLAWPDLWFPSFTSLPIYRRSRRMFTNHWAELFLFFFFFDPKMFRLISLQLSVVACQLTAIRSPRLTGQADISACLGTCCEWPNQEAEAWLRLSSQVFQRPFLHNLPFFPYADMEVVQRASWLSEAVTTPVSLGT